MKITVGQTKRGIILVFEDKSNDTSRTVNLSWREATGLYWHLKEAIDNPAFQFRDPKGNDTEVRNLKTIDTSSD